MPRCDLFAIRQLHSLVPRAKQKNIKSLSVTALRLVRIKAAANKMKKRRIVCHDKNKIKFTRFSHCILSQLTRIMARERKREIGVIYWLIICMHSAIGTNANGNDNLMRERLTVSQAIISIPQCGPHLSRLLVSNSIYIDLAFSSGSAAVAFHARHP